MKGGDRRGRTTGAAVAAPAARLLARIDVAWQGWLGVLDGVPTARLTEPGAVGTWSVHDLMGHLAVWEALAVERGRRLIAGEVLERVDWRGINAREAAARAGTSAAEQRTEMERTHRDLVAFLGGLSAAELRTPGLRGRLRSTAEHSDEHAAQVRRWRERVGV